MANCIRQASKIRPFVEWTKVYVHLCLPYSKIYKHLNLDIDAPILLILAQISPTVEDIIEAALDATKALGEIHNMAHTSSASCELSYPAPGNIIDSMYGDVGSLYMVSKHKARP
ncbi:hypothetical protein FRC08_012598 [Ceratobasidium sp. 394]|nr:hypothetical protein FRC08_012598 [Ceratobasidium sp. 394]